MLTIQFLQNVSSRNASTSFILHLKGISVKIRDYDGEWAVYLQLIFKYKNIIQP